jgi:hypothetical protein
MHPYASKTELQELHLVTGLEKKKIKRWMDNRRVKQSKTEDKPGKLFSSEEKNILLSFFKNTSEHPGPADLSMLANLIEKDSKKNVLAEVEKFIGKGGGEISVVKSYAK